MAKKEKLPKKVYLWQERKRNFLGLPWTFTKYKLDDTRLYINTGFLNTTEDEIRLYRITDVTLRRSFWQRIFGMGTIHCDSSDVTTQHFDVRNIKHPQAVKEMLSKLVDESRLRNRVYTTESVTPNAHVHAAEGGDMPPHEVDMTDVNHNGVPDVFER
jgi:uncharacterized membrane protein YdbT with pleckstrin-like domain